VFFREKILAGGYQKKIGKKNIVGGEKGKLKKNCTVVPAALLTQRKKREGTQK
jgi:hypothetical protein